jgi:hypothetical protein
MGGEPIVGSLEKPLEPAVIARSTSDAAISAKGCVKISKYKV